jgi:hypothetical protein
MADKVTCLNRAVDLTKTHAAAQSPTTHPEYLANVLEALYKKLLELSDDADKE